MCQHFVACSCTHTQRQQLECSMLVLYQRTTACLHTLSHVVTYAQMHTICLSTILLQQQMVLRTLSCTPQAHCNALDVRFSDTNEHMCLFAFSCVSVWNRLCYKQVDGLCLCHGSTMGTGKQMAAFRRENRGQWAIGERMEQKERYKRNACQSR